MAPDILIREAAPGELGAVEALVKTAYREFQGELPEEAWDKWMANISKTIHSGRGLVLVAAHPDGLRGAVQFFPDAAQAGMGNWPPGSGSIRILAVLPAYRGKGYGMVLTRECLSRARALQLPTLFLYTGPFMRAARHIYEKLGFRRAPEFDREPGPIAYRLDLSGDT